MQIIKPVTLKVTKLSIDAATELEKTRKFIKKNGIASDFENRLEETVIKFVSDTQKKLNEYGSAVDEKNTTGVAETADA